MVLPSRLAWVSIALLGIGCGEGGASPGDDSSSNGGSGTQVGSCRFRDEALARGVIAAQVAAGGVEPERIDSMTLPNDVHSLEGIECLDGLLSLSLFGPLKGKALDLGPLEELPALLDLQLLAGSFTGLETVARLPLESLRLSALDLGTLDALSGQDHIESLVLTEMPATDPSALGTFTNLKRLYLEQVDVDDLSALAGLKNLEDVELRSVPLSRLSGFDRLPALRRLTTFDVPLESLEELHGATNLTEIFADSSELTNLAGLEDHDSLASVSIYGNALTDISALAGSPALTTVWFLAGRISSLEAFATCPQLSFLEISNNQIVDLSPLAELPITSLNVSANRVDSLEALRDLPLEYLDVSDNPIGSFAPLSDVSTLGQLDMSRTGATSLEFLLDVDIQNLRAAGNRIADVTPLVGKSLGSLDLSSNELTSLPSDFEGGQAECGSTKLVGNALDAASKELLEALCDETTTHNFYWDGGRCVQCVPLL